MRVLVGCEQFGHMREAFRRRGHDAWSCDLKPTRDGSPHHLQCDVLTVLDDGWENVRGLTAEEALIETIMGDAK